jgi:hypothetical protein
MIQKTLLIALVWFSAWASVGSPQNRKSAETDAASLVHRIFQNEIKMDVADNSNWEFLQSDGISEKTYRVIETNTINLKMLVSQKGRPLDAEERKYEIERLKELAADPPEQQKERWDAEKAYRLMEELQPAFIYRIERSTADQTVVSFRPNPSFHPETREATVFHAMSGSMILDTKEKRLVEIQGRLMKDVKLGLGLMADLKQGGFFYVRKTRILPNYWKIIELKIRIEGKALFFKSISTKQLEKHSDFRRLPDHLTVQDGLVLLLKRNS